MALSEDQREMIKQRIEQAEEQIPEAEKDLADAVKAGIDVSGEQKRLSELKDRIRKMKRVYGR